MPRSHVPSYRRQKSKHQADRAFVEIMPGKRVYLGEYGSPESHQEYRRILGQIESGERPVSSSAITLAVLLDRYDDHARKEYRRADGSPSPGFKHVTDAIQTLLASDFVKQPASEFGPKKLKKIQQDLVKSGRLSRKIINDRIKYIRAIFKWAESEELVPGGTWEHLRTVSGLRKGRSGAKDYDPVEPVPQPLIDGVLPIVSRQVKALIELQLTMGARPGELIRLRPIDLDRSKPLWKANLNEHKTAHHGKPRTLRFGPKAQAILKPFMTPDRPVHMPLFSPKEADREYRDKKHKARKTPLSCGNRPKAKRPRPQLGDAYTVSGYRQAIRRACLKAFPYPAELVPNDEGVLTKEQQVGREKWRRENCWHPHQLRHNWIDKTAREHGIGVTQNVAGHTKGSAITATYMAENSDEADALMLKIG